MQASTQTEPPSRNYKEELKAQVAITEEAKKRRDEAIAQLGELQEQAAKREADLKRLLDERMAKLQAMEKEVADLQPHNDWPMKKKSACKRLSSTLRKPSR